MWWKMLMLELTQRRARECRLWELGLQLDMRLLMWRFRVLESSWHWEPENEWENLQFWKCWCFHNWRFFAKPRFPVFEKKLVFPTFRLWYLQNRWKNNYCLWLVKWLPFHGCFPKILLLETWAFLFHEFNASFTLEKKYNGYQLLVCDGSDLNIACNPEDKDT